MKLQKNMIVRFLVISLFVSGIILVGSPYNATEKCGLASGVPLPAKNFLIVGHRGAAGLAPENTLAAFRKACELGVDAVELDVFLTADSTIVVHHDYTHWLAGT